MERHQLEGPLVTVSVSHNSPAARLTSLKKVVFLYAGLFEKPLQ